jgi:polyisoprenoid-binding protein YceI
LSDDDKAGITMTIKDEVLKGQPIAFRSTQVGSAAEGRLSVQGDLELAGGSRPVSFELELAADGRVRGSAIVTQTRWGMKPYSALFGTLKVADDVEVSIDATLIPTSG